MEPITEPSFPVLSATDVAVALKHVLLKVRIRYQRATVTYEVEAF